MGQKVHAEQREGVVQRSHYLCGGPLKIPHYGKYSYLVFRKGINQAKGTWSVYALPLIDVFTSKEGQVSSDLFK